MGDFIPQDLANMAADQIQLRQPQIKEVRGFRGEARIATQPLGTEEGAQGGLVPIMVKCRFWAATEEEVGVKTVLHSFDSN